MKKQSAASHTMELYESPKKEQNNRNYGEFGAECICCGKPMKKGKCQFVQMNEGWVAVHPSVDENKFNQITGANSQGCFPIGNECAKKMKGFTFESELNVTHPKYK